MIMEALLSSATDALVAGRSLESKARKGDTELPVPQPSTFYPEGVVKFIQGRQRKALTREVMVSGLNVVIQIVTYDRRGNIQDRVGGCAGAILAAIYLVKQNSSPSRLNKLTVTLLLTPLTKQHDGNGPLTAENVNTGFCTLEKTAREITIYREEEWFKVLLHELMHALNCGPSRASEDRFRQMISRKWGVPAVSLEEAYAEVWARVINCSFYTIINDGIACGVDELESLIHREVLYGSSLYPEVLKVYGLGCPLQKKVQRSGPGSSTNSFSYYILGTALLKGSEDLVDYCTRPWLLLNFPEASYQDVELLAVDGVAEICRSERKVVTQRSMMMTSVVAIS